MNSYIETAKPFESQACKQLKITPHRSGSSVVREHVGDSIHSASSIASQPEQGTLGPTQAITEFLVRQQKLAALPPQNIPIFNGDPMDYRLFIRAFEHGVEDKTDSCRDRLYYMEQYTSGQPRELIRSCLHMEPKRGYCEAKKLLQEHFGNEYTISRAYIEKALNWPGIKSDDGAALQSFGLYLTGCRNAMADVAYMEELDNAVNMRSIISKLPYKMRERWRAIACGIFDKQQRRVKFSDLVDFVNKQAREASHPVFGSIMDGPKSQAKVYPRETSLRKSSLGRVCTTATTAVTNLVEEKPAKMSLVCAFSKPCLFCQGEQHTMEHCKKMKRSLHKEKIDFLRSKVLHMKTKVVSTEVEHKGVPSDNGEDASETGYGTVSYLLQNNKSNRVHCTLVMAKARVAPLKPITVPRMELAAATMAARMDKTLRSELQLQLKESVFWSDSTTVLKYIRNRTSRYRTFVANRVETILKLSEVRQWRYVNTSKNPADHVSRGLKVHAFMQNETWIQGPDFLTKPKDEWPQNPDNPENLTTEDPEVRDVIVSATATEEQVDTVQQFLEHYSSWFHLRKAVAWILKLLVIVSKQEDN
ncbi:hypothetical protein MHYP_G00031850 [Metynnis hypsauchen]